MHWLKTRSVVLEKLNSPPVTIQSPQSAKMQDDLNEALGQIALESQLLSLKQEGLRNGTVINTWMKQMQDYGDNFNSLKLMRKN